MSDGRFFEEFTLGEVIEHAPPRTLTEGDAALYLALYGSRYALNCARPFAQNMGYRESPLDDWLVFHIIFGKSVPDISLNALANLGYAEGRFLKPVYAGDTLRAHSEIIGLKENSSKKTGVVYVRTTGTNQNNEPVMEYCRWVMVHKRDAAAKVKQEYVPALREHIPATDLVPPRAGMMPFDARIAGASRLWDAFKPGDILNHRDGVTLEETEHMLATRLYQNTARVHFNQLEQAETRFGKRLIYGGHIISHMRALGFNGLEAAFALAGVNAGRHSAPAFAGDTIYGFSDIIARAEIPAREDIGAVRVRHRVIKNTVPHIGPQADDANLILDLDIWLWVAR